MKRNVLKRILGVAMSAAMLGTTLLSGGIVSAEGAAPKALVAGEEYTGAGQYIETYFQSDYLKGGNNAFEVKFEYTQLGTVPEDDALGYNNSLQFVVYDGSWGGWDPTTIGPNGYDKTEEVTPETGKEYAVTVPYRVIESKLSTDGQPLGINLQTGGIGDCKIKINSVSFTTVDLESIPTVLEGAWKKTGDENVACGNMKLTSGHVNISPNAWNIGLSNMDVDDFTTPMVAVTVEYGAVTNGPIYPQSEVLNADGQPIVQNYPQVTAAGEVTYLTKIPQDTKSLTLAYDTCTVKKVEIYDEDENYSTPVDDKTNEDIIEAMGAGWNLGNALDAVSAQGVTDETAWGNPVVNKRLFKQVSEAGFKTVRVTASWVDAISVNDNDYTINAKFDQILARVKEVVDMARAYDLFVIINLQHDGSEGVVGQWLDVDAENQTGIQAAFEEVWKRIATEFKDYDQHLIFESMNEVMEKDNYNDQPQDATWTNINDLNQLFVDTVRDIAGNNLTRFLLVPGYNTDINQTCNGGFVMPNYDGSTEYEMVSVHFYSPYNFTLNTGEGSTTSISSTERKEIETQLEKMKTQFVDNGIPVVMGEFGAVDKGNHSNIKGYITKVVQEAKGKGLGYIYWDNGYTGENGMGLWNRYTYARSGLGKVLIPVITGKK